MAAQAAALTFVLYLRPSETLGLTLSCLAPPSRLGGSTTRHWCITLHPDELGVASKTGEFDCSLIVDNPEFTFMANMLQQLRHHPAGLKPRPTEKVFPIKMRDWCRQYNAAAKQLHLEEFSPTTPVLYQLRHGGASHELASGHRDTAGLMKRGRWTSLASVKRYEKGGRLAELLQRLTPAQALLAENCQKNIGEILCGTLPPISTDTTVARSSSRSSRAQVAGPPQSVRPRTAAPRQGCTTQRCSSSTSGGTSKTTCSTHRSKRRSKGGSEPA